MNAVNGLYDYGAGRYAKKGQPNQGIAIRLMLQRDMTSPPTRSTSMVLALTGTLLSTLVGMTIFEAVKTFWLPGMSMWESHTSTIIFTTGLATGIAF
ncbi:MAG: hypothetical protein H7Y39_13200, partial [Nitrospiraceae bacterium]|nr:hypothetical protein [Nitrospiraceae bacterium]